MTKLEYKFATDKEEEIPEPDTELAPVPVAELVDTVVDSTEAIDA